MKTYAKLLKTELCCKIWEIWELFPKIWGEYGKYGKYGKYSRFRHPATESRIHLVFGMKWVNHGPSQTHFILYIVTRSETMCFDVRLVGVGPFENVVGRRELVGRFVYVGKQECDKC